MNNQVVIIFFFVTGAIALYFLSIVQVLLWFAVIVVFFFLQAAIAEAQSEREEKHELEKLRMILESEQVELKESYKGKLQLQKNMPTTLMIHPDELIEDYDD